MIHADTLRSTLLVLFAKRGHVTVTSASLIPRDLRGLSDLILGAARSVD
jgi:alanyl-tRNA synthetase